MWQVAAGLSHVSVFNTRPASLMKQYISCFTMFIVFTYSLQLGSSNLKSTHIFVHSHCTVYACSSAHALLTCLNSRWQHHTRRPLLGHTSGHTSVSVEQTKVCLTTFEMSPWHFFVCASLRFHISCPVNTSNPCVNLNYLLYLNRKNGFSNEKLPHIFVWEMSK